MSTKIHQKCPRKFTQNMSMKIHPKRGILVDILSWLPKWPKTANSFYKSENRSISVIVLISGWSLKMKEITASFDTFLCIGGLLLMFIVLVIFIPTKIKSTHCLSLSRPCFVSYERNHCILRYISSHWRLAIHVAKGDVDLIDIPEWHHGDK